MTHVSEHRSRAIGRLRTEALLYAMLGVLAAASLAAAGESPRDGTTVLRAHEVWRLGSDDETIIGLPYDVALGPDGNIYVLDIKTFDVKVLSPKGELLRTIGRKGEGPGEFSSPSSLVFLSKDVVGVSQAQPGRIVGAAPGRSIRRKHQAVGSG